MTEEQFIDYVRKAMKDNANLKKEIREIYQLAIDEIDEGGSEFHERQLAVNSINELIEEANEKHQ